MKDLKHVKVWELKKEGKSIKVATIEQGPRKPSMCKGCSAPCCRGMFRPVLTEEEFTKRKFPWVLEKVPQTIQDQSPVKIDYIVVLAVDEKKGCPYFKKGKCSIFPNCPKSCLAYDCRDDERMKEFVKRRKN